MDKLVLFCDTMMWKPGDHTTVLALVHEKNKKVAPSLDNALRHGTIDTLLLLQQLNLFSTA